jgi:hypothetical protein
MCGYGAQELPVSCIQYNEVNVSYTWHYFLYLYNIFTELFWKHVSKQVKWVQTTCCVPPNLFKGWWGLFQWGQKQPRLRMCGSIHPLLPYAYVVMKCRDDYVFMSKVSSFIIDHQGLIATEMHLDFSLVYHYVQNVIWGWPGLISIEWRRIFVWVECVLTSHLNLNE